MVPHSSTPAWQIPWTEKPGRLQSMGSRRVGHDWGTSLSLFTFMHWRRKWQPTPGFLPGESQGRGSLVGCHLWGRTESDTTEAPQQQQQQQQVIQLGCWLRSFLFFFYNFVYLFLTVLGLPCCTRAFLSLEQAGATLCCSAQTSHCGVFSYCRAWALGAWAPLVSVVVVPRLNWYGTRA